MCGYMRARMSLILAISLLHLLRGYQESKGVGGEPMGTPAADGTEMSRTNLGLEYYRSRIVVWLELGLVLLIYVPSTAGIPIGSPLTPLLS